MLKYVDVNVDCSKTFECVRGDLTHQLLTRINRTDAAHFYNLASLEGTLLALLHITARLATLFCSLTSLEAIVIVRIVRAVTLTVKV